MKELYADMPSLEFILGLAMMVSLTFYALLGGADYGGGVWDLLARGPRATAQRELIAKAIGPIWEANHVWLILVVVVLFTAFPRAFALVFTALHIPLLLMLFGIILRGSAFIFRAEDRVRGATRLHAQGRGGSVFAMASLLTPVLLGVVVGAVSSASIRAPGENASIRYFFSWVAPFPLAVGLFAVALFALLAAVYLTLETDEPALQDDFRRRAIATELVAGVLALTVFLLAAKGAPAVRERLTNSWWTWHLQLSAALMALGTVVSLWIRRFRFARVCAAAQVVLILWGWALAQYPYLVRPEMTIHNSAAPRATMQALVWALAAGGALLFPSYWYLFRVFKGDTQTAPVKSG
jgi:cytochrome d ubiquinol oxidase subunit II